ncbi:MAG: hypothetical protein KGI60_00285 [Patescibacteria group bacterium]|nr:hypothetical protein [Patescibacteria group bacterium]
MSKESFEFKKITKPTPEEILAAQRAADIAAREKAEVRRQYQEEVAETERLVRLQQDAQDEAEGKKKGGKYVIGDQAKKDLKEVLDFEKKKGRK